jgi:hypothetical protein
VLRGFAGGVRPEIAALADKARQIGVNIPVSSMSSNPFMRIVADAGKTLPFSGADASALANQRALQGALAKEMGSTADTFGNAEMSAARDTIKQGYEDALAKVPPIPGGTPLATDLADVGTRATRFLDPNQAGHVGRAIREVGDLFARGPITPEAYRAFTSSTGALKQIQNAAPSEAQPYLSDIGDALKARLYAVAPPGVADDLRNLDYQYRVMHTVKPLAALSTTGDISPGSIQGQVIRQSNKYDSNNYTKAFTGGGTVGTIGDIGKQFMGSIPQSGTAPRQQVYEFAKSPTATAIASIPSLAGNRWLQAWLRSPTVSGRIIDTSLGGATPNIGRAIPYGLLGPIDYESNRAP